MTNDILSGACVKVFINLLYNVVKCIQSDLQMCYGATVVPVTFSSHVKGEIHLFV